LEVEAWTLAGAEVFDDEEVANSPFFAFLESMSTSPCFLSSEEFEVEGFAGCFAVEPGHVDSIAWTTFKKSTDSLGEEGGTVCFGGRFGREADDNTWLVFVEGVRGITVLGLSEPEAEAFSSSPVMRFHLLTPDWHREGGGGSFEAAGGGGEGEP
jgi:hypothetical protein